MIEVQLYAKVFDILERQFIKVDKRVKRPEAKAEYVVRQANKGRDKRRREKSINHLTPIELLSVAAHWMIIEHINHDKIPNRQRSNSGPYREKILELAEANYSLYEAYAMIFEILNK